MDSLHQRFLSCKNGILAGDVPLVGCLGVGGMTIFMKYQDDALKQGTLKDLRDDDCHGDSSVTVTFERVFTLSFVDRSMMLWYVFQVQRWRKSV